MADVPVANSSESLRDKTVVVAELATTITGVQSFALAPAAPFAVEPGSAMVGNLDAEKVGGYTAAELAALAEDETVEGAWTFEDDVVFESAADFNDDVTCDDVAVGGTLGVTGATTVGALTASGVVHASGATAFSTFVGGAVTHEHTVVESGVITPTQLLANTDNWNPTGLATARIIRANTNASRNLSGIVAPTTGRRVLLINQGAQNLVLTHDATSTAANRFYTPNGASYTLTPNASVELWYDLISARWRVLGPVA